MGVRKVAILGRRAVRRFPQRRRAWGTDFPKADRQFVQGVRRLTRIHTRSAEQVIDLEDGDDLYYWPWLYAVEVGQWNLSDAQCQKLRDYLLRGGFLMVDDFHGGYEWEIFMASMSRVFPDRTVVEIENKDPIFHILYDLDDKVQVAGVAALDQGLTYERFDSQTPHWRGSTTIRAGSWWRLLLTRITATPGNGPTRHGIRKR